MKILVTHEITNRRLADLITTGLEGGMSPWLSTFKWKGGDITPGKIWYYEDDTYERDDFAVEVTFDDPDAEEGTFTGKRTLTIQDFHLGLQTFAVKVPDQFAEFLNDNEDANTGDCFLQCLILGDIVYG